MVSVLMVVLGCQGCFEKCHNSVSLLGAIGVSCGSIKSSFFCPVMGLKTHIGVLVGLEILILNEIIGIWKAQHPLKTGFYFYFPALHLHCMLFESVACCEHVLSVIHG